MWHGVSSKFYTPSSLTAQVQESFPDDVSSATNDFNVGYLEGNTRHWIVVEDDLLAMYSTFCPSSKINLWCDEKMISTGRHDDYTNPPKILLITGSKKPSSMVDALTSAASANATAIQSPSTPLCVIQPPSTPQNPRSSHADGKFSLMSGAKLRRSCLDDLKLLKELYQDSVLSEAEFTEQKQKILCTLKDIH